MPTVIKETYGGAVLVKSYCGKCKSISFIIDGKFSCCDRDINIKHSKTVSFNACQIPSTRPSTYRKAREKIAESQDNKCIYCENSFGSIIWSKTLDKYITLSICIDHFIPWRSFRNNKDSNRVASCQTCNSIKSEKHFDTIDSAKEYILKRREELGYTKG